MRTPGWLTAAALLIGLPISQGFAQGCPISYGLADDAKPNKLYLYYPATDDPTYPNYAAGVSPAHRFDVSELTGYTGTATELRTAVADVVRATYCEFNVQVRETTTAPPTTFARRNTVAIGTDFGGGVCFASEAWGVAQNLDIGDPIAVDFSRVWAGSYNCATGPGGALNGANSTTLRWARAIGGTASHEAGHNYGLVHGDGLVLAPGEDVLVHHIMAAGSNYSYDNRAGYRRHFSNHELSLLAGNVGLSVQTMWNWDFVNPNAETAYGLRMTFLSTQPSIIMSWAYTGSSSPWSAPAVTGPLGTQTFKGTVYNRYQIEWTTAQPWAGPTPGQISGGTQFHVGATFSAVNFSDPDAIIITSAELLDSRSNVLALRPRLPAFDAGTPDSNSRTLNLRLFNVDALPFIVRDFVVRDLPRVINLDAMVRDARMVDMAGEPFEPWPQSTRTVVRETKVEGGAELSIPLARLDQPPYVRREVTAQDCERQDRMSGPDVANCKPGVSTDLFPATTSYVTASIVDPQARHWDPKLQTYVVGPLETRVYYQIAGRRLDREKIGAQ